MSRAMDTEEREAFLSDLHVGVIGIERPGRGPLCVPISLCAQDETPPYKYVSVDGPIVSIEPSVKDRDELTMATRYLGEELAFVYVEGTKNDPSNRPGLVVRMRPEAWNTTDFSKALVGPKRN